MKRKELFNPFLLIPPYFALLSASIVFFIPIIYFNRTLNLNLPGLLANLIPGFIIGSGLFSIVGTIEWQRFKVTKKKRFRYFISTLYGFLFLPLMSLGIFGSINNLSFMMNWLAALCVYSFLPSIVLMIVQIRQKRIVHWEELNRRRTLLINIDGMKKE